MGKALKDLKYLLEKILQWDYDKSGRHPRYRFIVNDRIVAATHYSHSWSGNVQISDTMLTQIAREMHCDLKTLKSMLQGNESSIKDYYKGLVQRGHLSQKEYDDLCGNR